MKKPKLLFEERFLIVILIIQALLVCAGVLSRFVFNWSLSFTEEITRYSLIWLACLGLSAGCARDEMIGFKWPGRKSRLKAIIFLWIGRVAAGLFVLALLGSSIQMIKLQWDYNQLTSVMGWPIVWVSVALPVTAVLVLLRLIPKFQAPADD